MLSRLRNYALIGLALGGFYFLLAYHFIILGPKEVELLRKSELSLKYTFFSLKQATPEAALRIKEMRRNGLGELMVEKGMINRDKLNAILREYHD